MRSSVFSIAKHSDFKLDGISDARTLLHAKIIRDADKLDNCRVKLEDKLETFMDTSGRGDRCLRGFSKSKRFYFTS